MKTFIAAFTIVSLLSSFAGSTALAAKPQAKTTKKTSSAPAIKSSTTTKVGAQATPSYAPMRAPATLDSGAALEVRGQSRNLSMMLVLKNKKRDIDFVKPRENYSREVQNTSY